METLVSIRQLSGPECETWENKGVAPQVLIEMDPWTDGVSRHAKKGNTALCDAAKDEGDSVEGFLGY